MKKSIPHLITAALFLCSTIIGANAQCTINSNTNVSSINPASCNGDIIITNGAVLTINGHTNWSAYAPITIIVENNASIDWGGNFAWDLPAGSGIILITGGKLATTSPCNSNRVINIGSNPITTCSGGNGVFSFAQINAAGGTPTVSPTFSEPYLCSPGNISALGNTSGYTADYLFTYQWNYTGPGTIVFSSPNTANTLISGITVPGEYTFTLSITATHGNKVYTYSRSKKIKLHVPPTAQTVNPTSTTTCRGSNNIIHLGGSQTGVTYNLFNSLSVSPVQSQPGTGNAIDFIIPFNVQSETFTIVGSYAGNPCLTQMGAPLTIVPAANPKYLSKDLDTAKCIINNNNFIDFIKNDRIAVSINSHGQNLGEVMVVSYVNNGSISVPACLSSNLLYTTEVLGRRFAIIPQFQPVNPVSIRAYISNVEVNTLIPVANANPNPNDNFATSNIANLVVGKYSNNVNPQVINGTFSDNCVNGSDSKIIYPFNNGDIEFYFPQFVEKQAKFLNFSIQEFSEFWFHGNDNDNISPLPIELSKFDVNCKNEAVEVTWSTFSEVNNEYFLVERSSNMQTWEQVEIVSGAGNSNMLLSYSITDYRPLNGSSYYRLSQFDYDGQSKTFAPKSTNCVADDIQISVFPNPASENINISITQMGNTKAKVEIINVVGVQVFQKEFALQESTQTLSIPCNHLANGTYIVRTQLDDTHTDTRKIIVNK